MTEKIAKKVAFEDKRYQFGSNWLKYLRHVDEREVEAHVRNVRSLFGRDSLQGLRFLDIGSGSGLSSLAAYRMGAWVDSFDYDPNSVAATSHLRERAGPPEGWSVRQGSVLDTQFMDALPLYDIVHSWGVLHHTGSMWEAIRVAAERVKPGGLFMIGIYHKKLPQSRWMWHLKRVYSRAPGIARVPIKAAFWATAALYRLVVGKRVLDFKDYEKDEKRGMNYWRDLDDWLGGFPFEYATAEEIVSFVEPLEFDAVKVRPGSSMAEVAQYVFRRRPAAA